MRYHTREASPCDKSGIDNVIFSLLRSLSLSNNSQTLGEPRRDGNRFTSQSEECYHSMDSGEAGKWHDKRIQMSRSLLFELTDEQEKENDR